MFLISHISTLYDCHILAMIMGIVNFSLYSREISYSFFSLLLQKLNVGIFSVAVLARALKLPGDNLCMYNVYTNPYQV